MASHSGGCYSHDIARQVFPVAPSPCRIWRAGPKKCREEIGNGGYGRIRSECPSVLRKEDVGYFAPVRKGGLLEVWFVPVVVLLQAECLFIPTHSVSKHRIPAIIEAPLITYLGIPVL